MTTPLHIDSAPPAPSRREPDTFSDKGDAFLAFIEAPLVPQMNAMSDQLNAQADAAVASAATAASNATVSSQSRADAVAAAAAAVTSATSASDSATVSTTKAAEALASANAAAAIQGIPSVAGNALKALRVNATANGIEWVADGNALTFAPVQQGTGVGQLAANLIKIGRASGPNNVLKATIDTTDIGFIPTAVGPITPTVINFGKTLQATAFNGAHVGDGSALTGFTAAQIAGALTYMPANAAMFAPAGAAEVGKYIDMHAVNNTNSFDVRLEAIPLAGSGGDGIAPDGTGDLKVTAARVQATGTVSAQSFIGNGAALTGFTSGQITGALTYTPLRTNNATASGFLEVLQGVSDFSNVSDPTLRVTQSSGNSYHSAHMEFVKLGFYGVKVGLDNVNNFAVGGYSQGSLTYRFYVDAGGNAVAGGNVTAYSDIRFKTEIKPIEQAVDKLIRIDKGGFEYLDTNTGERKYGVSAQGVQRLFPHAVVADQNGYLSVAYGQLALAALIEVTRELNARLLDQENKIKSLSKLLETKG